MFLKERKHFLSVSHGMRVSFGLTFDHHGVFGINNVLLHGLFDDGWGLPDCREEDAILNTTQ